MGDESCHALQASHNPLEINVTTLSGPLCNIHAEGFYSVRELKDEIKRVSGVPVWEQRLAWESRVLMDAEFLHPLAEASKLNLLLVRVNARMAAALESLCTNGFKLCNLPLDLQEDPSMVMAAVHSRGSSLEFALACHRSNCHIILAAVSQDGYALRFARGFRNDRGVVVAAVKQNGRALQYADESLRRDSEIVRIATAQNATAQEFSLCFNSTG